MNIEKIKIKKRAGQKEVLRIFALGRKKSIPIKNIPQNKTNNDRENARNVPINFPFSLSSGRNLTKVGAIPKEEINIRKEETEMKTEPSPISSTE